MCSRRRTNSVSETSRRLTRSKCAKDVFILASVLGTRIEKTGYPVLNKSKFAMQRWFKYDYSLLWYRFRGVLSTLVFLTVKFRGW